MRWPLNKKNSAGRCATAYCRNKKPHHKRICHKCAKRKMKANNPITYFYHEIKNRARKRGIPFSLSKDVFKNFCEETGYLENVGRSRNSSTIDRIDHQKGYEEGNIQCLSLSENSKKGNKEKLETCPF